MPKKLKKKTKKQESGSLVKAVSMKPVNSKEKAKKKAKLDKVVAEVNKKYGNNFVVFGASIQQTELSRIPMYVVPVIDFAIGGGIPIGRITTISGPESSCKSAIGYRVIASFQQQGRTTALIDVEGTYEQEWGAIHGIDNDLLLYNRPESAEEGLNIASMLAKKGIDFIMIDSIEALEPNYDFGKEFDEGKILGVRAVLLGQFLRKMNAINNGLVRKGGEGVTLLLINQLREKPMAMGDPEYEPGGRAVRFYASVQIRLRRAEWIKQGTGKNQHIVGQVVKFKVNKNKTYKMLQTGEFDFYTDKNEVGLPVGSFDEAKQLAMLGFAWGIIQSPSQGYFIVEGKKIHGIDNTIQAIRETPELTDSIRDQITELVKVHTTADEPETREYDPETGEVK